MARETLMSIVALTGAIGSLLATLAVALRMKKMFRTSTGESLDEVLLSLIKELEAHRTAIREMNAEVAQIRERLTRAVQHVETIRFNAFGDTGGQQSFATAFTDETGNGVVISTLYARDRVSTFGKPIVHFASTHQLSKEEEEAITLCKKNP